MDTNTIHVDVAKALATATHSHHTMEIDDHGGESDVDSEATESEPEIFDDESVPAPLPVKPLINKSHVWSQDLAMATTSNAPLLHQSTTGHDAATGRPQTPGRDAIAFGSASSAGMARESECARKQFDARACGSRVCVLKAEPQRVDSKEMKAVEAPTKMAPPSHDEEDQHTHSPDGIPACKWV